MDKALLQKSLRNLEDELKELDSQLVDLRKAQVRRDLIFQLVTGMRFALDMGPYGMREPDDAAPAPPVSIQPETASIPVVRKSTMWQSAKETIRLAGCPMELSEIVESLRGFGFHLEGRSGKETVRAILYKKSDVFERMAGGKYRLK